MNHEQFAEIIMEAYDPDHGGAAFMLRIWTKSNRVYDLGYIGRTQDMIKGNLNNRNGDPIFISMEDISAVSIIFL